ncbi:hypothetical protein [Glaciibacter psychrotolerans]|uniref:Uncharacterized protein n=1 Tax=Glaciibacter psychrotolerans TaxID=670054 RepID=A0A7Z0ECY1_9MICO|nr:hypothetical protein [Leifsonia psychrotolerans]NYJ19183.1 hypothetical protein [Leifsonia psychrotolerans]
MVIEQIAPAVIICHGPQMAESSRDSMGVRWCFKCRKRAEFTWVVMAPVIDWDNKASVYAAMWGPTAHSECGCCDEHGGELFPGWTYRWED